MKLKSLFPPLLAHSLGEQSLEASHLKIPHGQHLQPAPFFLFLLRPFITYLHLSPP
jgi:hypothetical protein